MFSGICHNLFEPPEKGKATVSDILQGTEAIWVGFG